MTPPPALLRGEVVKVLFVTSEAAPFVQTGGLGDVSSALPAALSSLGADVRVVLPCYRQIKEKYAASLERVYEGSVSLSWREQYMGVLTAKHGGVTYYFIDNEYYFDRPRTYGEFDDAERYAFFSKAALSLMDAVGFFPDVLHANDWQSALSVIYLKRRYSADERWRKVRAVYTIHNIEYRGIYGFELLGDVFGLGAWDRECVEYNGKLDLTKGALVCADAVTTVSPRYASELTGQYAASQLYHIMRQIVPKTTGILNGIDCSLYDPQTDGAIAANYSASDLRGKRKCRAELERLCGFERSPAPIVAVVSRLAEHKGIDLILCVLDELISTTDLRFAILGTGEARYEEFFRSAESRFPGRVHAHIGFDPELARRHYAGADMLLMPSLSEPCGLSQMIASRYGALALVRETGGLCDTISPYNEYENTGNGFSFAAYNAHDMMNALRYARSVYDDRNKWLSIVRRAMRTDFSWDASAKKYAGLYSSLADGGWN